MWNIVSTENPPLETTDSVYNMKTTNLLYNKWNLYRQKKKKKSNIYY